jgi:hypothetical protein
MSKIYFVIKLYMFRASSVPIIRRYLLYARQLVRFMQAMWPLPSRDRLELRSKMPETCWVLWQNKCWIFDASSWLFYTKLGILFRQVIITDFWSCELLDMDFNFPPNTGEWSKILKFLSRMTLIWGIWTTFELNSCSGLFGHIHYFAY